MIRHIWFDFANTLFRYTSEYVRVHNELLHQTYAKVVGEPLTEGLKRKYQALYQKYKSNSQVFMALDQDPNFWASTQAKLPKEKYIDQTVNLPNLFKKLKRRGLKISLFTNAPKEEVLRVLPYLNLGPQDFDFLLTGEMVEKKPSLDGFYKIIKLSRLKPAEILYVGERIPGEILPAKKVGLKTALVWSNLGKTEADFTLGDINQVVNCLGKVRDL